MPPAPAPPQPATPAAAYAMLPVPDAQALVLAHTPPPLPPATLPALACLGRVLAAPVTATTPLPPFAASIKDGYAVRVAAGAGDFPVAFDALAGALPPPLPAGTVAYISTGAPLPAGADAVVQIEDTERLPPADDDPRPRVRILKAAPGPGADVRATGSDIGAGETVLAAGDVVGPAEVGLAATVGVAALTVHGTPLVAVLSTGDEVVEADAEAGEGQIRDANRPLLLASALAAGATTLDLGIARDDEGAVDAAVARALAEGADVLLTSGGVSMGDKDYVKGVLEARGTVHFGKVLMKPGKPLTFAVLPRPSPARPLLAFGLPGNPASAAVTFALTVAPCLRALAGHSAPLPRRVHAALAGEARLDPARPEYARAVLTWRPSDPAHPTAGGGWTATGTGNQISSRLTSVRGANALLELPRGAGVLAAGTVVTALLVGDVRVGPVGEAFEATPAPPA